MMSVQGGARKQKKTKKELTVELFGENQQKMNLNLKCLQNIASNKGISIEVQVPVVKEGWVGKPKGLKQVAWEQGLLDPDQIKKYEKHSKDLSLSLTAILNASSDFQNETS